LDYFKIRNFEKFQHYKNDRPMRWIKVYRDLLGTYEFRVLPDSAKAHLLGLFLLQSENPGKGVLNNAQWLRERLAADSEIDLSVLDAWITPCSREGLEQLYSNSRENSIHSRVEKSREEKRTYTARRARRPAKRNPLDQSLTDLIDYFKNHDARKSRYVPKWDRDKKLLRPYVLEKGHSRVREMLDAFILREKWEYAGDDFARNFILNQPLSIQGFVACSDRLDNVLDWDTEEKPYGEGNQKKDDEAGPTLL
jgi:hypothetical protein